jgi:hypothetical protein
VGWIGAAIVAAGGLAAITGLAITAVADEETTEENEALDELAAIYKENGNILKEDIEGLKENNKYSSDLIDSLLVNSDQTANLV